MYIIDKKIDYFISVVEEGSFSAASKKLYISQANLSKQIAALEKELGLELFDRSGYRPALNDAGKYFYDKVKVIKEEELDILEVIRKYELKIVRAGFTGVFENRELIDAIRDFQDTYQSGEIILSHYDFEGCANALIDQQIDVGFGLESTFKRYKDIQYEILHGYNICFVCTKKHPFAKRKSITVDEIRKENLIILSRKFSTDYYNDFMESCRKDGYKPNVKKEVDTFDELILSVCLGEGVALCGESSVRDEELVTIPIESTAHSPNYVVAYRTDTDKKSLGLFLEHIRKYFGLH